MRREAAYETLRITEQMATTLRFLVMCRICDWVTPVDYDEMDDCPICDKCGHQLSTVVHVEGFEREPKKIE